MPYGYSLDCNITNKCNLNCKHCYMKKDSVMLTAANMKVFLDKLPSSLKKLVISGGEPYTNYDVLYRTIDYSRERFGESFKLRINTNAVSFYETDKTIENELEKLCLHNVTELMISSDVYHIDAGVRIDRINRILEIQKEKGFPINIRYLDIGKGIRIGEYNENDGALVSKSKCLNRNENIFRPYLFSSTTGEIYICAFRSTPSLGNLFYDSWGYIANSLKNQLDYLSGNIISPIIKSNENCYELYEQYEKYGECFVCKYNKASC